MALSVAPVASATKNGLPIEPSEMPILLRSLAPAAPVRATAAAAASRMLRDFIA